jgi:hypothetical protein
MAVDPTYFPVVMLNHKERGGALAPGRIHAQLGYTDDAIRLIGESLESGRTHGEWEGGQAFSSTAGPEGRAPGC